MAAKKPKAPTKIPRSRETLLEALWDAQARAILKAVESGDATAATLGVARQFLADNGVDLGTLRNMQLRSAFGGQDIDLSQAPTFSDDEDDSSDPDLNGKPDPLRVVPDFAPPREDDDTDK